MKKVLAIGGSNSKKSINKALATYVAHQLENVEVLIGDLSKLDLPLYSPDREVAEGQPAKAIQFLDVIRSVDAIVLSLAEHNGNQTAAFKNLWDWLSRVDGTHIWAGKPMLLMATSPGKRGGASVLKITKDLLPFYGGNVVAEFSLPLFDKHFTPEGITDPALGALLATQVSLLQAHL